jgi:hypothetical protein
MRLLVRSTRTSDHGRVSAALLGEVSTGRACPRGAGAVVVPKPGRGSWDAELGPDGGKVLVVAAHPDKVRIAAVETMITVAVCRRGESTTSS